jgi:hypothetical protein
MDLKIPKKTLADPYRLQDFKDDFNLIGYNVDRKIDSPTTMKENYTSIIPSVLKSYSYATMIENITTLALKYEDKLVVEVIGQSVLGRDIKAVILGNRNGANKLFVMGGQHARENHMAPILLKQIEYVCENWNEYLDGEKISDIFANSAIFYVPCANPDGAELCRIGIDSVPPSDTTRIANIKAALETKIRTNLVLNSDVTIDTDLPVQWTGDVGIVPDYVFRNQDMYMWKSNANGVDVHNNNWELGYNGEYVQAWATQSGFPTSFASEDYIGSSGFSEPETFAIKNFIDTNDLSRYTISYHGRGPTMFYNYKQKGKQVQRNKRIAQALSDISRTPYSESNNGPVGFAGYMYSRYSNDGMPVPDYKKDPLVFAAIRESGWGFYPINPDNNYTDDTKPAAISPLKDEQFNDIWRVEKEVALIFLKRYARRQDINVRDNFLTEYDFSYNAYNSDLDGVKVDQFGNIEQWGLAIVDLTGLNTANYTKEVTLKTKFPLRNSGGFANVYTTINNGEIINVTVDRNSLDKINLVVRSNVALNRSIAINWRVWGR